MRTQIIATLGPKSDNPKTIENLIKAGVGIFRNNFSHCSTDEFKTRVKLIKKINRKLKTSVKIMADLQGPRIRVGILPEKGISIREGKTYTFTSAVSSYSDNSTLIPLDDPYLHLDIKKGDPLFLTSGEMELTVTKTHNKEIHAKALKGGLLFSHKGINVPKTNLRRSGLTKKDIQNAGFAVKNGADMIALSFVQSAEDVLKVKKLIGGRKTLVVAKIERAVALKKIDEIIQTADAIMIARGDLGIEIPIEDVPIVQKNLVRHSHWHGKPSIIATQMLNSMVNHHRPTRAEVSDVANSVIDGADALMLSDETAAGDFPVAAVAIMKKIIQKTEDYLHAGGRF